MTGLHLPQIIMKKMNLCIGSNTIPELMNVNAEQYRALLKYDLIQPIGKYYENYASDKLKSYIESGGEALQKVICNEDGEMMAIPAPNITAGGVNEMWIRQDWLDNLGLEAPRTWDEMVAAAEAFVKEDPDGNGENDTIGILGPANSDYVNGNGGNRYGLDPLFSAFQSYPKYWLKDDSGKYCIRIYYRGNQNCTGKGCRSVCRWSDRYRDPGKK